jgi:hypothetical protein
MTVTSTSAPVPRYRRRQLDGISTIELRIETRKLAFWTKAAKRDGVSRNQAINQALKEAQRRRQKRVTEEADEAEVEEIEEGAAGRRNAAGAGRGER